MSVSVGYAIFTQIISLNGNISFGTQGDFTISKVMDKTQYIMLFITLHLLMILFTKD